MKDFFKKINEKHLRIAFSVIMVGITLFFLIQRLINIPLTWDEGLTYVIHCKKIFRSGDFVGGIVKFFTDWTEDAGNNHFLNTMLIGILDEIVGVRFSTAVIRFPIVAFGIGYLIVCTRLFLKEKISWIGYVMLLGCPYVNEFFMIARGYAMAAALVFFGTVFFRKWINERKPYYAVLAFYTFFLAEAANTAVLLIVASFVIVFALDIIIEKDFLNVLKRLWLPIALYGVIQVLVIIHHFNLTKWEDHIYADYEHGVRLMMYRTFTLPAGENAMIANILFYGFIVLAAVNGILFIIKLRSLKPYILCCVLLTYFTICFTAVNVLDQGGYPMGRVLIITYPLVALAFDELFMGIRKALENNGVKIATNVLQGIALCFVLVVLVMNTDYTKSTDWPEAAYYKSIAYDAYNNGIKDREYFRQYCDNENTDAVRYWREKILFEDEDTDAGQLEN